MGYASWRSSRTLLIWPAYLFLAGHRRVAVVATATADEPDGRLDRGLRAEASRWSGWRALAADRHGIIPTDASLQGYGLRLGMPQLGSALALVLMSSGAAPGLWRRRADALEASGLAIAVAILAAPLSWFHYTLFLIPALLARPWGRTLHAAAFLLWIPVSVPLLALVYPGWGSAIFGSIYLIGRSLDPGRFHAAPDRPRCDTDSIRSTLALAGRRMSEA